MTIGQLASQLAKREGKKSQARVGDIREILKILVQLEVDAIVTPHDSPLQMLQERANKIANKHL